jgi:hypothetical protein
VACVLHARLRAIFADRMRSVGKRLRDESGKYPVNENDEEIYHFVNAGTVIARSECHEMNATNSPRHCERSEAIHRAA